MGLGLARDLLLGGAGVAHPTFTLLRSLTMPDLYSTPQSHARHLSLVALLSLICPIPTCSSRPSFASPSASELRVEPLQTRCGRDSFEPNNARAKARNISTELLGQREVEAQTCYGDEDWYTIWLTRGQLVELRLEGAEVGRWPAMDIYAPRKRTPQGVRRRGRGVQTLKVYAKHSGRYRLKVRGRGDSPTRYRLQLRPLTR